MWRGKKQRCALDTDAFRVWWYVRKGRTRSARLGKARPGGEEQECEPWQRTTELVCAKWCLRNGVRVRIRAGR
eukprot:6184901-Pleurochrysis_carterae.AAC.2